MLPSWPSSAGSSVAGTAAAWYGCASAAASASWGSRVPGSSPALPGPRGSGASPARQSTGIPMEGAEGQSEARASGAAFGL